MNPWPISPLTQKDLDFAVVGYGFSDLTANALADEPGLEAAMDTSLLDFGTSIADQTALIITLFDGLDDLGLISGEIDGSPLDGVLGNLANAASAGDAMLNDYQGQIGGPSSPPAGGGSGGGTPQQNCGSIANFGHIQPNTMGCSYRVVKANNLPHTINVSRVFLDGANPDAFKISPTGPLTIQGNALLPIDVTPLNKTPGDYSAVIHVINDGNIPDETICVFYSADPNGSPCGTPNTGNPGGGRGSRG